MPLKAFLSKFPMKLNYSSCDSFTILKVEFAYHKSTFQVKQKVSCTFRIRR